MQNKKRISKTLTVKEGVPRMERKNCWEVKKCGRQPGGENAEKLGACLAALPNECYDGVNKGKHGGRFCWAIAGTLCGGKMQGTFAMKLTNCLNCEFLKLVNEDEGRNFALTPEQAKMEYEMRGKSGE